MTVCVCMNMGMSVCSHVCLSFLYACLHEQLMRICVSTTSLSVYHFMCVPFFLPVCGNLYAVCMQLLQNAC